MATEIENSQDTRSISGGFEGELDTVSFFSEVLLVEDDPGHAKLLQRALRDIVGEVVHVTCGNDAIKAVETSLPELIICDLHLPDMTAIDVLKELRESRPALPVIVLTSSNDLDLAVAAMREGAWDFMVKQFSGELKDQISLVVERTAEKKLQSVRETQLRAERDAFWQASDMAQDGLAILGTGGSVVFSNKAFEKFISSIPGDFDPKKINTLDVLASLDEEAAEKLRKQIKGKSKKSLLTLELEVPRVLPDGKSEPRYFELSLSSVAFDTGLPGAGLPIFRQFVLWTRNITRRKEQERFQRDLLSTTSHDLKGPLGAILTSAELLSDWDDYTASKSRELVTRIASCARNSISIIDELLSARRIQDGVLVLKPRWYAVAEILEDLVLDYLPTAKAKSISFTAKPVDPELQIFADRLGLNRVLGNLVSNALKFTSKEGAVTLAAERVGAAVRITVTDTGPGIESEARHVLFERYSRLEKHSEIEGTGLGLYVAKNIVDGHSGRIEVQSELGVGTAFIVTLPDEKK